MSRDAVAGLVVQPAVAHALAEQRPVLALESTIITHGMPYPRNLETALSAEAAVRELGATPATIAIVDGLVHVGLQPEQLEVLARPESQPSKCSVRDIPFLRQAGATAGTTVAATMHIAVAAGIRVFATGGIGGVHRGAEVNFDVSADLQALASLPMVVVCAGPKSVLDLGLTLEYLETHGVPVVGYRTHDLPAFYSQRSRFKVDYRLDDVTDIAAAAIKKWQLGVRGSILVANPVPEADAMDQTWIESVIAKAIRDADAEAVSGKALTPYLLSQIEKATGGASLNTNVALMINNARLGASIAAALSGTSDSKSGSP